MSAAIAMVPSPAPHERPPFASDRPAAPTSTNPSIQTPQRHSALPPVSISATPTAPLAGGSSPRADGGIGSGSGSGSGSRTSPTSSSRKESSFPKIMVKKEPVSPGPPASRPRPRRLDLSKNTLAVSNPPSAHPLTAREGIAMQEVGIACLSPGFVTQDPVMKEQLQRSLSVREQQRTIIEARLQQQSAKGDGPLDKDREPGMHFAAKTPGMSRRNKAPPGLSIVAPSHTQFAHERVIQSAPLGHSFTGRQQQIPPSRHASGLSSNLSSTSHIHHVPIYQNNNGGSSSSSNNHNNNNNNNNHNNRLPPISDVFGQNLSGHPDNAPPHTSSLYPSHGSAPRPLSPGHPSSHHHQAPVPARPRDYKSAEEAQQELAGGRPELLPKIVHYNGHQPPTPPSPVGGTRNTESGGSTSRRRTRAEYEEGSSPPLGHGPASTRRAGAFGAGRDSPETVRQKKEEFLRLCDRAWDLFHS